MRSDYGPKYGPHHGPHYGLIWDMDGVLVDTAAFHYPSWLQALSEVGISFSEGQFRDTFGMNNAGILEYLLGHPPDPDFVNKVSDRKESLFRESIRGKIEPLPGARLWLERLAREGVAQAIASSAPMANIELIVEELGLSPYLDALVSGADLPGKPDPTTFQRAAEQIQVSAARCIVVEDAIAGVVAARRAGMKCVAVTTTNPAEKLAGADLIIERLDALPEDAFSSLLGGELG
jgi:HAD superfamily hydrolase (TIGR01509 family)